jgi:hypothetical protein
MKLKIAEKAEKVEINLTFPDRGLVDLEVALYLACRPHGWRVKRSDEASDHAVFLVQDEERFLGALHASYDWEPPTKAWFENRPSSQADYVAAAKESTRVVAREFLKECAHRGLVDDKTADKALKQIRHDSDSHLEGNTWQR